MLPTIELEEPHRIFVELVYGVFEKTGRWPIAQGIGDALLRLIPPKMDVYDVFRTIPTVIGHAQLGNGEAQITPIAVVVVERDVAHQALDDLFRAFRLCLQRYLSGPPGVDALLSQADLAHELGFEEIRIRRTYLLLQQAMLVTGGPGTYVIDDGKQYGWVQVIYPPAINRYRDVQTLDEYLDELYEERNGMTGSPGFIPVGMPIEPIKVVRFSPDAISPSAAIGGPSYHFHIEAGSTVGNIVAGSTVNNIESNIDASRGVSGDALADALKAIVEACLADNALEPEQLQEAVGLIEYLSEAAAAPEDQRRGSVIGASVRALAAIMTFAATTGQVWQQWSAVLEQAFHLSQH